MAGVAEATGASPSTAAWHHVNLPRDGNCTFRADRSYLQGACVVGAIERQLGVLASRAPDDAGLKALKYAVHLVRDAHQPLHTGFAEDSGGASTSFTPSGEARACTPPGTRP